MVKITKEQIRAVIAPHKGRTDVIDAIVSADLDILTNTNDAIHWVAQHAYETSGFTELEEKLSYSAGRLTQVWPRRFNAAKAKRYAHNPQALANNVYANRLGNGPEASGDGWKYRGRGLNHLTGRANYREVGQGIGEDLEGNPELAGDPNIAIRVSLYYWRTRNISAVASRGTDAEQVKAVTRLIRGSDQEWEERMKLVRKGKTIFVVEGDSDPLTFGDKGAMVTELQKLLVKAGYHEIGIVDGDYGNRTRAAVQAFQADHDLSVTGSADVNLVRLLRSGRARPISDARREATMADLGATGSIRKISLIQRIVTGVGSVAGGGLGLSEILSYFDVLTSVTAKFKSLFGTIEGAWPIFLIVVCVIVYLVSRDIKREKLEDFKSGKNV